MTKDMETMAVNAIRVLSADAIQKANSGHPGLPLGVAPMAYEMWAHYLNINPVDPTWEDRDRFILSGGHGSMLLYSLLHLFGFGLTKEDVMQFRQLGSLTPGHPEYGHTVGIEATTGPLGAGISMAVGMAAAEKHLASIFNKPGYEIVNHRTFVIAGDGDLMEGISSEALSLAGTWNLSKLTVLYDSNKISIEGSTDIAFREDVVKRAEAFGFKTLEVDDGNDLQKIAAALDTALQDDSAPYFIKVKTTIGFGCPAKQGSAAAHGEPLGEENVKAMKETLEWPSQEPFYVPEEVYAHYKALAEAKQPAEDAWKKLFDEYCAKFPEMAELWARYHSDEDVKALREDAGFFAKAEKAEATRASSGVVINYMKDKLPNLFGGSADLGPSTKTEMKGESYFSAETPEGKNIHFGVREMAMAGIANGMLLHGGLRTFVATFFVFSDYLKPMARLAALMKIPQIFVLTHDSIGVGEDGPTHEPIEQLAMLRSIPNFDVIRPCDRTETEGAWLMAMEAKDRPTALVLTRQNLEQLPGADARKVEKGAYIIDDCEGTPEYILIATGSEVALAVKAKAELGAQGKKVRVVSMPNMEAFDRQDAAYKESVLPNSVRKRVAIEALSDFGWYKYVGLDGKVVSMHGFGASGNGSVLFKHFGFTVENVVETVNSL
ncbi:transketolase [Oribacterium sp. P9]|uniref:transketolase n=1 Tax=Oribacterium sp. P9 TaxID=3378068 RepID=UPI002A7C7D7C|nr:transketolase [Oribacterium sp.]MDY2854486.1 transketolase [Oliverpabstia sp.]